MPFEFTLPDVGEGVSEGELVAWLVDPGEYVEEDQPVAEVETDKALVELPSPVEGTVAELRAEPGDIVPVGDVLLTFEVADDGPGEEEPTTDASPSSAEADATPSGVFAPPRVRSLARSLGVDLSALEVDGRISEADVRAAAETDTDDEPPTVASEPRDGAKQPAEGRERTLATPATRRLAEDLGVDLDAVPTDERRDGRPFVTEAALRDFAQSGAGEPAGPTSPTDREPTDSEPVRLPYRGVRRTIGERMEQSAFTAPHVTHFDDVDVSTLVETKRAFAEEAEARDVHLTYLPFVMKAVVRALGEHPMLNSRLDEENEEIVQLQEYHIGIAVATDDGLMVPVVRDVDRKGIFDLAAELSTLIEQAHDRTIDIEDLQGSTFTITNVGGIGGRYATPLLNPPNVGILALGAIDERPRVVDGDIRARHVLPLSLSFDHRVVDGAIAAAFTNTVMEYLKTPALVLVE